MTETDYVKSIRVLAAKPAHRGRHLSFHARAQPTPRVDSIRLAEPQFVLAVAEMNDGALLFGKAWVDVATDGCK